MAGTAARCIAVPYVFPALEFVQAITPFTRSGLAEDLDACGKAAKRADPMLMLCTHARTLSAIITSA